MKRIYGYARISRKTQNIERQVRNISEAFPDAKISQEAYTGTKMQGRKKLDEILKQVQAGDTIVFDSVSRMARNAAEGMALYEELYNKGVDIVFLKEAHCNTSKYREALQKQIDITVSTGDKATDNFMNTIISALNKLQMDLARKDIELAFSQAQKEVDDLHERTAEGIETARREGKQIGQKPGAKLTTKKSIEKKVEILKHSKDFEGTLNDIDCMKLTGLSRNTFYKYKRELKAEQ
jgi:DNA invertase Pin-like site-specific DNA recombinase